VDSFSPRTGTFSSSQLDLEQAFDIQLDKYHTGTVLNITAQLGPLEGEDQVGASITTNLFLSIVAPRMFVHSTWYLYTH
jgi:hypothetical protein